jgi:hypothetical protein
MILTIEIQRIWPAIPPALLHHRHHRLRTPRGLRRPVDALVARQRPRAEDVVRAPVHRQLAQASEPPHVDPPVAALPDQRIAPVVKQLVDVRRVGACLGRWIPVAEYLASRTPVKPVARQFGFGSTPAFIAPP